MTFFQSGDKFVKETLLAKWKCCATQIRLLHG